MALQTESQIIGNEIAPLSYSVMSSLKLKHKHCVNEYSVIVYVFGRIGQGYSFSDNIILECKCVEHVHS